MTIVQPLGRETIIDRRQPNLRWSAVLAGAALALGTWLLLQLFGTAVALYALDSEHVDRARAVGIGSTAWSAFSAVVGMGLGGALAARLAGHRDRRVAGLHGMLVWAISSLVGFVAISAAVAYAAPDFRDHAAYSAPAPGDRALVDRGVGAANLWLLNEGKPLIETDDFIEAARRSVTPQGYDPSRFISALDDRSALSRGEIQAVVPQLGAPAEVVTAAARVGEHRAAAVRAARDAGCMFAIGALALALGLVAAIGGALLVVREFARRGGYLDEPRHTTAPYGVPVQRPDVLDDEP
jgi:hypothetical protein